MSIIYDALKKVENSNNIGLKGETDKEKRPYRLKVKIYFVYLLTVCLGVFIGNIFFSFLSRQKNYLVKQAKPLPIAKEPALSPEQELPQQTPLGSNGALPLETNLDSLVLNGVFFSENEGYALINNKVLKEGDVIEGAIVKRITLDGVELEANGSTVKLSAQSR